MDFAKSDFKPPVEKGTTNMDMKKIQKCPEFIELLKDLRANGVKGDWLCKNGFIPAHMLLSRYL